MWYISCAAGPFSKFVRFIFGLFFSFQICDTIPMWVFPIVFYREKHFITCARFVIVCFYSIHIYILPFFSIAQGSNSHAV